MRSVRSEIESAKKPINPAEAEAQQVAKVWMKLCRELTHEAVQGKTWKHLTPEARLAARNCLQAALEAMPK